MATIHVDSVTQGWPEMINGLGEVCNVDLQVDGKWVRMGYLTSDLPDSAATQSKLTADAAVLTSVDKQYDTQAELGATPIGTYRADLIPADFDI